MSVSDLIKPSDAIQHDPPHVWMTSYFGFTPEDWGYLSFSDPGRVDHVKSESVPGFLAVIYGSVSHKTPSEEHGRLLGVYQCSHVTGGAENFLSPLGLARKRRVQKHEGQWNNGFQAVRAWRVTGETAPHVRDFAPVSYTGKNGTSIARHAIRLQSQEAVGLLNLDLEEVPVYGTDFEGLPEIGKASDLFDKPAVRMSPSKPGPVSKTGYQVRESEGPKYLYILKLDGPAEHLIDDFPEGHSMVKVGFSKSPLTRCGHLNGALPNCNLRWQVYFSGHAEGKAPYPSSSHAIAGENAMKLFLDRVGQSLGGEFFLADEASIHDAWRLGAEKAKAYTE